MHMIHATVPTQMAQMHPMDNCFWGNVISDVPQAKGV